MAKKIEVYVDGEGDGPEFVPYKEGNSYFPCWEVQGITLKPKFAYWKAATVVIHEGNPERVYTQSELEAILRDFRRAKDDPGHFIRCNPHWWIGDWEKAAQEEMLKKHGITLDPTEQE